MAGSIKLARIECQCSKCQSYCERVPGWFAPGEAQKVAEYLCLSMDQLFQTKLAVEYFVGDAENGTVFVLSPATDATQPGTIAPFSKPLGTCVFFDSETRTCTIHPVKPFECAIAHHDDARRSAFEIERVKNIRDWSQAQHEIESVYGAKPEEPEGNLVDVFDLFVNRGLTSGWD